MRHEDQNPLDLNNFPDDSSRDGRRLLPDGSPSGSSRERQSGKEYECRFCSLKFCKSQALGGHMNRHRQERETESLNKARELVLRNDSFPVQGAAASPFCYHPAGHIGDPTTLYRPIYAPRLFSAAASSTLSPPPPPPQPYFHSPPLPPPSSHLPPYISMNNECYLGHALVNQNNSEFQLCPRHQTLNYMSGHAAGGGGNAAPESSYTCIAFPASSGPAPPPQSIINHLPGNGSN